MSKKKDVFDGQKVYELPEERQFAPITKEEGKACRHRLEGRWYRRMIEINILMIVVVIGTLAANMDENRKLAGEFYTQLEETLSEVQEKGLEDETKEDNEAGENTGAQEEQSESDTSEEDELTEEDIPIEVTLLAYGMIVLVGGYLGLYYYFAYYRSMSLRITERNFPEVYELIDSYSKRLGIRTPKAYVMQQNGVLNAFSTFIFRKQWIMIHAELFEVAYREHKDMDALGFVIAHELAHIYYGHATLHYNLPIWFSRIVPLFSGIASRTREYSCDRLAQRLTGNDGIEAMLALVVDRHLYKMVDKEDYIEQMQEQKGFFIWIVNLFADHPVMCRRIPAMVQGRGSGRLY